jgi:hypothetical protein
MAELFIVLPGVKNKSGTYSLTEGHAKSNKIIDFNCVVH